MRVALAVPDELCSPYVPVDDLARVCSHGCKRVGWRVFEGVIRVSLPVTVDDHRWFLAACSG